MQAKLQCTDSVDESSLPKALSQASSAAFDLSKGPLIHVTLIPLRNQQEHVMVVNLHYAVADGWSLGVLFKDISRAYNGLKRGKGNALGSKACCLMPHPCASNCRMYSDQDPNA